MKRRDLLKVAFGGFAALAVPLSVIKAATPIQEKGPTPIQEKGPTPIQEKGPIQFDFAPKVGKYPDWFLPFSGGDVCVIAGDTIKLNVNLSEEATTKRSWDITATLTVAGCTRSGMPVVTNGQVFRIAHCEEVCEVPDNSRMIRNVT